jgi:hypothetical protein
MDRDTVRRLLRTQYGTSSFRGSGDISWLPARLEVYSSFALSLYITEILYTT